MHGQQNIKIPYAMSLRKCGLRENRCNKSNILHKGVNETVRVYSKLFGRFEK